MNIIKSLLSELQPCAAGELIDFLRSDLFYEKGYYTSENLTNRRVRYYLDKISQKNNKIFKFQSESGFKIRYGNSKFKYYSLNEPRFLTVKGHLNRCLYCGMPIYCNESDTFHFKFNCKEYIGQDYYSLLKIDNFWAIVSNYFVYGILDNLQSSTLRLPGKNPNYAIDGINSELWKVNDYAREKKLIEKDQILSIKAKEFIVKKS